MRTQVNYSVPPASPPRCPGPSEFRPGTFFLDRGNNLYLRGYGGLIIGVQDVTGTGSEFQPQGLVSPSGNEMGELCEPEKRGPFRIVRRMTISIEAVEPPK